MALISCMIVAKKPRNVVDSVDRPGIAAERLECLAMKVRLRK